MVSRCPPAGLVAAPSAGLLVRGCAAADFSARPEKFGTTAARALDNNLLYVADGARDKVQILLLKPESMRRRGDR